MARPHRQAGFTLVELVIATTVLAMLSLALYGVVAVGARAASAAERRTEQARRMRLASGLVVRQLHSAVALHAPDEDGKLQPFFEGEPDRIVFVSAQPQAPDASGLAVVEYWLDDDQLRMTERPYYLVLAEDTDDLAFEREVLQTTLLYDVRRVEFSYRRSDFDSESWEEQWSASETDQLPAVVRIRVEPKVADGPSWEQEVPIFAAVFNEISGEDDFSRRPGQP